MKGMFAQESHFTIPSVPSYKCLTWQGPLALKFERAEESVSHFSRGDGM